MVVHPSALFEADAALIRWQRTADFSCASGTMTERSSAHAADRVCLRCLSAERAFPVAGAGGAVRRVQQPGVENRSIFRQSHSVASLLLGERRCRAGRPMRSLAY